MQWRWEYDRMGTTDCGTNVVPPSYVLGPGRCELHGNGGRFGSGVNHVIHGTGDPVFTKMKATAQ
jgi:hypothetical protein